MFVIFQVNVLTCQNFKLSHIYCIFVFKISFFEMKFFKLVIWYPNIVPNMWNDMV
jgi:hypothetical protein